MNCAGPGCGVICCWGKLLECSCGCVVAASVVSVLTSC